MSTVIDRESIGSAYADIAAGQRSLDWFLLGYAPGSHNKIVLIDKSDGGINSLKQHLNENMVAFGYIKVIDKSNEFPYLNPDFIHLTFIGKNVKPQERSRAVIHRLDIQQEFPRFLTELECFSLDDVSEERMFAEIQDIKEQLAS